MVREKEQQIIDDELISTYPQKHLNWVFFLIFNCSILVNIDHGAVPSYSEEIKSKLNI